MKTYQVTVKIVGEATVEVEAADENDAASKAKAQVNLNFDNCEADKVLDIMELND